MPASVSVVEHPVVRHKLSRLRDRETPSAEFRRLLRELGGLIGYEATRDLALERRGIATPVAPMQAPFLAGPMPLLVPVLRAGVGLADGLADLLPEAPVGHVGFYRDPQTLGAVKYYSRLPADIGGPAIVCDPMIATAGTAIAAVDLVKRAGAGAIRLLGVIAAPEGLAALQLAHPDVPVWVAAIDERLDAHAYIVPGLGDAGDRLFGTE